MSERVNHVGLAVADLEAEAAFWVGALGFERVGGLDADDASTGQLLRLERPGLRAVYLRRGEFVLELLNFRGAGLGGAADPGGERTRPHPSLAKRPRHGCCAGAGAGPRWGGAGRHPLVGRGGDDPARPVDSLWSCWWASKPPQPTWQTDPVIGNPRTYWEAIEARAAATPDVPLTIEPDGTVMTFAGFRDAAERAAAGLAGMGVAADTRVSWQLPNGRAALILSAAPGPAGGRPEPDHPHLPGAGGGLRGPPNRGSAPSGAVGVAGLRLRDHGQHRGGHHRRLRCAGVRRRPPRGRPGHAGPLRCAFGRRRAAPGSLDLLHLGHHRRS